MSGFSVSSTTYKKERGETTEWEDILIKKGIIEEKEENRLLREEKELQKLVEEAVEEFDPLENQSLKKLDKLANESEEYSDDRIIEEYRKKRIEALKQKKQAARFGNGVKHIKKSDFVREVTDASQKNWVVLLLFKDPHDECAVLGNCMEVLSKKFSNVSFLRIVSTECVENFPDKNLPCLIMYHKGEMQHQTVGLSSFGGIRMTPDHLEWRLSQFNVLETEFTILNNPMTMKGSPTLKTNINRNYVDRSRNKRSPHSPNKTTSFTRHVKGGMLLDGNNDNNSGDDSDDY
eukprot:g4150.t1